MECETSISTRRTVLATSAASLGLAALAQPVAAQALARPPSPHGPGSASGAPHLPLGFRDVFTSRYIDANGLRLHAVTGGEGPPLLLVHG